jgi:uncharacterized protein YuzE
MEKDVNIRFDSEVNALYIKILDNTSIENSEEIKPGVIYDYSKDGNVVGIEIFLEMNPDIKNELKSITSVA